MFGCSNPPPAAGPMPRMDPVSFPRRPCSPSAIKPPRQSRTPYIASNMVQCNMNTALQNPDADTASGRRRERVCGLNSRESLVNLPVQETGAIGELLSRRS
jgi:hypothetical protein